MSARIEIFPERADGDRYTADASGEPRLTLTDMPTGRWYWRLVGGNGETVCVSEAYTRKASARRGAIRVFRIMYDLAVLYGGGEEHAIVEVSR